MFHNLCWVYYQHKKIKVDKLLEYLICCSSLLFNYCKPNYDCTFKNNDNDDTATIDVATITAARKSNDNSQSNTIDGNNLVLNNNDDDVTATIDTRRSEVELSTKKKTNVHPTYKL